VLRLGWFFGAVCVGLAFFPNVTWAQTSEPTQTQPPATQTPVEQTPPAVTATAVPTARTDEVVFVGEVPAPPGTTVTVQFLDPVTLAISTCATATSTPADQPSISWFVLRVPVQCAVIGFPPKFCWGQDLCSLYIQENFGVSPMANPYVPGTTIALGLLSRPLPMTPSPPNTGGGPGLSLPRTGAGQKSTISSWMLWFGVALVAAAMFSGCVHLAGRRRQCWAVGFHRQRAAPRGYAVSSPSARW
jgi:hypothetical protein